METYREVHEPAFRTPQDHEHIGLERGNPDDGQPQGHRDTDEEGRTQRDVFLREGNGPESLWEHTEPG